MNTEKVLIVDDDRAIAAAIDEIVAPHFPTVRAYSGEEAIDIIDTLEGLRAVISDFTMQKLTGADVLRRTRERHRDAVRILISSDIGVVFGFESQVQQDCEPHVLLPKPVRAKELRAIVTSWKDSTGA